MKNTKRRRRVLRERAIITALITWIVLSVMLISYINTRYNREAIVDSIEDNVTTFVDISGNTWEATDVENVVVGQKVILKMHNNVTDYTITDDKVVDVKETPIRMK